MDQLACMRTFVDVVDAGGFSAAARRTGTSTAGASKRVQQLEAHLGIQLLQRSTRSVSLTDAGQRYVDRAREVLVLVEESDGAARAEATAVRGTLRLTMPPGFADARGAALIAGFSTRHPEVRIDVDVTHRILDLVEARIDVAIRLTRPADSALIARRLGPAPLVIVASPAYLAEAGTPRDVVDLPDHRCVFDTNLRFGATWPLTTDGRPTPVTVAGALGANSPVLVRELALRGAGLALLPQLVVADALAAGTLIEVLPGRVDAGWSVFAVTVARRRLPRRTRAFLAFLADPPEAR